VRPNASGDFRIMCNEFCGIGHHTMVGRVIVVDAPAVATTTTSTTPAAAAGGAR
jgi:heme/copper-type cytochrome/quinol oxidase subunit 2